METVKGVGLHPVDLSDGRIVGPGDVLPDVSLTNLHNKSLLDDGDIAVVQDGTDAPAEVVEPETEATETGRPSRRSQGRSE